MRIAFMGLGRLGRELAAHLAADGHDVQTWNRTGATRTPAETVAGADAVVTVLFGPDAVREVVTAADLPVPAGALWLDVTTVAPHDTEEFAAWARARRIDYVHAPVIGSLAPARARALGVLLGGDPAAVQRARALVSWADPAKVRTFDSPAAAATGKLLANLALAAVTQGMVEALTLGRAAGLATGEVLEALELTLLAGLAGQKGPFVASGDYSDSQFSAAALAKDVRLMLATAGAPLPAAQALLTALDQAVEAGRGEDDFSVVAAAALSAPAGDRRSSG